jgi:hypothetical protein
MGPSLIRKGPVSVRTKLFAIFTTFFAAVIFLAAPPAMAASCSDASCEGLDPAATGCSSDSYVARSATLYRQYDGAAVGVVQLKYSPACGTNWIKVISYIGSVPLYGLVGHGYSMYSAHAWSGTSTSIYTDMTATRYETACGYGMIQGGNQTNSPTLCA